MKAKIQGMNWLIDITSIAPYTNAGTSSVAEITPITTVADTAKSLDGKYFTINSPTAAFYVWFSVGTTEVSTITNTGIDVAGLTQGDYFTLDSGGNGLFHFWIDIDAAGTGAPAIGGTNVVVSVATAQTAQQVADAIVTAVDGNANFSASNSASTVTTVLNAVDGNVVDASDGAAVTGFTFGTSTQGAVPGGTDPAPGGTGIPVVISDDASAQEVSDAVEAAVDANANFGAVNSASTTVTITNATDGDATDATIGDSGFSLGGITQGVDFIPVVSADVGMVKIVGTYTVEKSAWVGGANGNSSLGSVSETKAITKIVHNTRVEYLFE